MVSRFKGLERALLVLFVASGFAGLIYQAIWSHYLGLTLGHAAYAQTLVLAIFMGGMALGAWLVSRRTAQWRRLILVYAVIEILVGLAGLAFHAVFQGYTTLSQDVVYPLLDGPAAVRAWQWGTAALLIAPQSILLGMTFPLMSGGYLRVAPKADGEILGGLYFTNSIGAAAGALVATFILLPWVGMPGTIVVAGLVNIAVGLLAWVVARRAEFGTNGPSVLPESAPALAAAASPGAGQGLAGGIYPMLLAAAAITGASSFVYEIGWVRMLNQALGTTVHSFELMLAAFILGLAFGGLWIRKRSQSITDVIAYAGYAQIWMGVAALISLPVFAQSFRWVGALMQALPRTDDGYWLYSLGSAGIALLVMFPAAFFAGMTLPLFTVALLRRGAGESSIGRIYAANTLGAILGVVLAVHVLVPVLGLRLAVTLAALADIALGLVLLRRYADAVYPRGYFSALAATVVVLAVSLVAGRPNTAAVVSGVFRTGQAELTGVDATPYLRDGKTATVAVYVQGGAATISTNGKPDASLSLATSGPVTDDEITMVMASALPLAAHPDPKRIAVIGWGSGLTTHSLLGSDRPEVVDSVEIEKAMYEGASLFGDRVVRAYRDPRSQIHIDDARTYFSSGRRTYDVIVSEPSNPWVSGVASLFTHQFYRFLGHHLDKDGILVQWVQAYELNDELLATMLAALLVEFPHVDAYLTNQGDVLMMASHVPLPALRYPADQGSVLAQELARVGLANESDFLVRRLGSERLLKTMVMLSGAVPHDDFYPVVSLNAPKARFKQETAARMLSLRDLGMPVLELTDGRRPVGLSGLASTGSRLGAMDAQARAQWVRGAMLGDPAPADLRDEALAKALEELTTISGTQAGDGSSRTRWLDLVAELAESTVGQLPSEDLAGVWIDPQWVGAQGEDPVQGSVLSAYAAAAARDGRAMQAAGLVALERLDDSQPMLVREHMLVIAILGAFAQGDPAGATAIERSYGGRVPLTAQSSYGGARAYFLAWSDLVQK